MEIDVYKEWLGIPEGPRPPDHYQLLRLKQFEDSADKIRANYKKLNGHVRKYATGQYSEKSQDVLNELAKAMLCLTDHERKHEYDRLMGREFEEEETGPQPMEVLLLQRGHISQPQLDQAKGHAESTGLEMRDVLVQLKMVDATLAAQTLAEEVGLSFVDLTELTPEDDVLDRTPRQMVKQHSILPLFIDDDVLLVACANPLGNDTEEELRLRFDLPVRTVLAAPRAIDQAIAKYYAPGLRNEAAAAPTPTKGPKKPGEKKGPTPPKPSKPQGRLQGEELKEQRKKNRMLSLIGFCWSIVAAYMIWNFVGKNQLFTATSAGLFLGIPGITAAALYVTLWNKD